MAYIYYPGTDEPRALTALGTRPSYLPVDLLAAKQSLGFLAGDRDEDIRLALLGVTDKVERRLNRILLTPGTTVVQSYRTWPSTPVQFDWAPVLAITEVSYVDFDTDLPVVIDPSNYYLVPGEDGRTAMYWDSGYSFPGLATNGAAVTVTYTAGYNSAAEIPDSARNLIKIELRAIYTDDDREAVGAERLAKQLYDNLAWGNYK